MSRIVLFILFYLFATVIPGSADAAQLLFDQGHGQAFTIEKDGDLQLSTLAALFSKSGLVVQSTKESLTTELLSKISALIISGPFRPFSVQEIDAVKEFIKRGGRVAIMLHIAQPMWGLLDELGVDVANGVLREQRGVLKDKPTNFVVSDFSSHDLTEGVSSFNLYGGWPLRPAADHARVIARTSDSAWVDLNQDNILNQGDAEQQFGVVVCGVIGQGEFLVFADDAIFQNRFLSEENLILAENLGQWLSTRR